MSKTLKLRDRNDLLALCKWFAQELEQSLSADASFSYEVSPEGRDPASIALNLDTSDRVATAQIWDTGDVYLECLEAKSEGTLMREHHEALDIRQIKEHLLRFISAVGLG